MAHSCLILFFTFAPQKGVQRLDLIILNLRVISKLMFPHNIGMERAKEG